MFQWDMPSMEISIDTVDASVDDPDTVLSDASSTLSELPADFDICVDMDANAADKNDFLPPSRVSSCDAAQDQQFLSQALVYATDSSESFPEFIRLPRRHDSVDSSGNHPSADSSRLSLFTLEANTNVSRFEELPNEIFQKIASIVNSDVDLLNLLLTCQKFAKALVPENSSVWKTRFLAQYDYPIIEGPFDFRVAYQLRKLVLSRFSEFGSGRRTESAIQLEVLKDMVLETYNKPAPWLANPKKSHNLAAFKNAPKSTWMITFLTSPFFAHQKSKYGRPYSLFDGLQMVFSYLLLSPRGLIAYKISTERSDYDLERVYNWEKDFATIFRRLPEVTSDDPSRLSVSPLFPNLSQSPSPPSARFKLDLHTLLHIRNFWHRHCIEDRNMQGEETYATMMRKLDRENKTPRQWDSPIQEQLNLEVKWAGHYSCLYSWPKTRMDLEERQSDAEGWNNIDPLTLDISSYRSNACGIWPPIFSTIPAFANSIPTPAPSPTIKKNGSTQLIPDAPTLYLRGLAPFIILSSEKPPQHISKYHPYTSLRLRGVIHPIPTNLSADIPGFHRVAFILFKPTTAHLLRVLEHASEEYGDPFQQSLNNSIAGTNVAGFDPIEAEKIFKAHLTGYLAELKGPVEMDRAHIERMEDAFYDPVHLDWADVEFAYAYEGVLTPGGKVMMGRWWRIGANGEGEGREVGNPVGTERGPFCFWC